mmetsp:Transcript_16409/g.19606  ORF Transcript_16409/g.19606 Transcript_16409/m.19606 type:complete len:529 (+) Transcript_16409:245-1831(+)|eukprot:CAMPEP_0204836708 /NCGR_PEP_ID=MMETSP1346-20131115/25942_1 /ASSEMBLY_ACC=CAM_ASM_000771 /TAXON_ID=215587 /ORGANISM="Aplanochytrium stocchinoi, Strain GSBS06" /LENGTH=528 /DNA_ID=CAMNT_0051971645 /DNA_START=188 /DNA_END=1774 /DNA_ORIENTATION=-
MKVVDIPSVSFPEGVLEYVCENGLEKDPKLCFLFCRIEGLTIGAGKSSLLKSLQNGDGGLSILFPDNSVVSLDDNIEETLEKFLQKSAAEEEENDFVIKLIGSTGGKKKSKSKSNTGKSKGKKKVEVKSGSGWLLKDDLNAPPRIEHAGKRLLRIQELNSPAIFEVSLYTSLAGQGLEDHPVEINIERKCVKDYCGEVECVCLVRKDELLTNVLKKLRTSLEKQLNKLSVENVHQATFVNEELGYPLTVSFPSRYKFEAEDEKQQVQIRKEFQEKLGLPLDKPFFRRFQSLQNVASRSTPTNVDGRTILRSPHLGPFAKAHGIDGAKTYIMSGDFDYYHYGVGHNDGGWGCAYRSLQMVMSWYELAGLTDTKPLSILRIQENLFNMGVMDADFYVGCKQWIGSQEVSWLLDSVCGASSRFVVCTRGSEILEKSRELSQHFMEQQTPIVICGGKLALTLLGIAWNEQSGKVSFLIADPHYTGEDELNQVQSKTVSLEGYKAIPVSWRGAEAFTDRSSYTLCLPQRKCMI